jgi:hypothetical protein
VVAGEELASHHVAGLEVGVLVGAGADGLEVGGRLAGLVALEGLERVLGQDHPAHAAERVGPERGGLLEGHLDGVAVDLLGLQVLVGVDVAGGGGGVGDELSGEDAVIRGEGLAVVPDHPLLELPRHRPAVLGHAPVLHRGDFGGQIGGEVPVRIPGGEGLVEDARPVLVLGASGEVRIQEGCALPPERLQRAAAAPLGRLVRRLRLGVGHAGGGEHLGGEGGGEPEAHHHLHEAAAAEPPGLDVADQRSKVTFFH